MANQWLKVIRRYRWRELGLLIIPFAILLLEMVQLLLARQARLGLSPTANLSVKNLPTLQGLIPVLGLILALLSVNFILSFFFPKADQVMLPLVGLLSGLGVLMSTRIGPAINSPALGSRQLVWVLLGLFVFLLTLFLLRKIRWLSDFKYIWALIGIILVCTTFVNVIFVRNFDSPTHDQLNIGPFNFQPSELLKICLVIFFASYISENMAAMKGGSMNIGRLRLPSIDRLGPLVLMLLLALALFLVVREFGLALLIYGIFLCMIYLGTNKISYIIGSLLVFAILGFLVYSLFSYIRPRFIAVGIDVVNWTGASENLYQSGIGYQVVQGIIALSSGGIIGSGLGLGDPTFVPVVQSDMIFTGMGEEFGLAGLFAIIGIYLLIVYRGYRIAIEARDSFSQLLAAGLTSIFAIQSLIIIAGNMKILPLTGIPLPFLSYGGSSVIANYIIIGILLRISHNTALQRDGLA